MCRHHAFSWFSNRRGCPQARRTPRRRSIALGVEPLETRLAPATLVNPQTVTYQDADGDRVTVSFSRPILNAGNVNQVFQFDSGSVNGDNSGEQQLQDIKLTGIAAANGVSLSAKAVRGGGNAGDGFVDVGAIDAAGINLGTVTIAGDLGRLRAGDNQGTAASGVAGLQVQSMGRLGTTTQASGGNLASEVDGLLGSLRIATDLDQASLVVKVPRTPGIGSIVIGGSIIGGSSSSSGSISAGLSDIGRVVIGGSIVGGSGAFCGIATDGSIGTLTLGGNLEGGTGQSAGSIFAGNSIAALTIRGSVHGAAGLGSGLIRTVGLGTLRIAGDLTGGAGNDSGSIRVGSAGSITIGHDVIGGSGSSSGEILTSAALGPVRIGGDLRGGDDRINASLSASGYIEGDTIAGVTIGGSIIAGTNPNTDPTLHALKQSGSIRADHTLGPVSVGGSLVGNNTNPVVISALGQAAPAHGKDLAIAAVHVAGRVEFTNILAGYDVDLNPVSADAQVGTIMVGLDWIASDLRAGAVPTIDSFTKIADPHDDPAILSSIAGITIGGRAMGDLNAVFPPENGFAAESIAALKIGGVPIALHHGAHNDHLAVGPLVILVEL